MDLSSILKPEAVKVMASTTSKKRLFHDVADMVADAHGVVVPTAVEALLERENLGPTAVGKGVALPHARLPELSGVVGGFVRLDKPLEFDAVDKQPVDLVFCLFAPEAAGVDHLKALALVARTLRDEGICEKLRSNRSPAALHGILTQFPTSAAA
ncbi:MAG: PTS sugar transporter subunit IIA [Pseudomonadota bacterium]